MTTSTSSTYYNKLPKLNSTTFDGNTLLKTAVTPVWYNDERTMTNILLDEGAQNLFISHLVDKFKFKPTEECTWRFQHLVEKKEKYATWRRRQYQLKPKQRKKYKWRS